MHSPDSPRKRKSTDDSTDQEPRKQTRITTTTSTMIDIVVEAPPPETAAVDVAIKRSIPVHTKSTHQQSSTNIEVDKVEAEPPSDVTTFSELVIETMREEMIRQADSSDTIVKTASIVGIPAALKEAEEQMDEAVAIRSRSISARKVGIGLVILLVALRGFTSAAIVASMSGVVALFHQTGNRRFATTKTPSHAIPREPHYGRIGVTTCLLILILGTILQVKSPSYAPSPHGHVILPRHYSSGKLERSTATLRDFLMDEKGFHLAMAPAFFGFYGYFGALMALEQEVDAQILAPEYKVRSVAGASAGAMAAILIAAGISPQAAVAFCSNITLDKYADFPGTFALFRGNRFEALMQDFLEQQDPPRTLMEDAIIPVTVSAFDLQTLAIRYLRSGSMARAARASATFPFLFQPVGWTAGPGKDDHIFVDGGLCDGSGVLGLSALLDQVENATSDDNQRVLNLSIGGFLGVPPGPSSINKVSLVVSISIHGLPRCSPWTMSNGPLAVEAARRAIAASLDIPLFKGLEKDHFELHIDASRISEIAVGK